MKRTLAVCCIAHFFVDFSCAYLLFSSLRDAPNWTDLLVVYNFCAFAVQMPLGLLEDRWRRNGEIAAAGAILVALAYTLVSLPGLVVIVAGLGNAAFHVGGGLETLSLSGERAGPLGLFVSPGAVGLFLGTAMGKAAAFPLAMPVLVLLLSAVGLLRTKLPRPVGQREVAIPDFRSVGLPLLFLLMVVILRSFVGMSLSFPWKGEGQWTLILIFMLAAGKAAGGYLADSFGFIRTAVVSLALSTVLLFLSDLPVFGVAAILLFNMTMPLTLWASARLLPHVRGFAFGLLTFGLFLGFLPVAFGAKMISGEMAAGLAVVSLLLLLPGLGKAVER